MVFKQSVNRKPIIGTGLFFSIMLMVFSCCLPNADAAQMSDYCVTPPYIGATVTPNLLLMIDNSASMYDLAYTDSTNLYCANAPTTSCTAGSTCAGTAYCLVSTTTATTTTTTAKPCTSDADCTGGSGDHCSNSNQCTKSTVTTTTVTQNPIQCTQDSTCYNITPNDICNNKCTATHTCYDATYNDTKVCSVTSATTCSSNSDCPTGESCVYRYSGYFNTSDTYSYDFTNKKFTGGAIMPGTCYSPTGSPTFACVNVDNNAKPTTITQFVASGNFLNWLTMSKFDIEKQILTGGKYLANACSISTNVSCSSSADCPSGETCNSGVNVLVAETRGCSGRKFIKVAPGMSNITFDVRGGSPTGITSTTSLANEWGQTYIDIYNGTYNAAACNAAANDWMNVNTTNLGTVQNDTKACVGSSSSNAVLTFNQSIHDCFWYYNGHGLSNLNPIENACVGDWAGNPAANITSPDAPDAICSDVLTHANSLVWPSSATGYNLGYLGLCYSPSTGVWDNTCAYNENVDYCAQMGEPGQVTDPPSNQITSGTIQNAPGFMMEAGLASLTPLSTMNVRAALAAQPSGLIANYQNLIRFGAMTFQNNGSASECNQNGHCSITTSDSCAADSACPSGEKCVYPIPCVNVCSVTQTRQCFKNSDCPSGETCGPLTKTDGGIITSYIGAGYCSASPTTSCVVDTDCSNGDTCTASIGDHSSGLIHNIDNIQAASWTPFDEAFYNAIGYYARSNYYPVPPATATPLSRGDAGDLNSPLYNFNFTNPSRPAAYLTNRNPSQQSCQKNNILLITDGMSTADQNPQAEALANTYAQVVSYTVGTTTYSYPNNYGPSACLPDLGSRSLPVLTWLANNRNIKSFSPTDPTVKHCSDDVYKLCTLDSDCGSGNICSNLPTHSSEYINTYIVFTGGSTGGPGLCDPKTYLTAAASNGGTSLFQVSSLNSLNTVLTNAFDQVAAKAAAGTAASVLASGEGSGANIVQSVYYPHRKFFNSTNSSDYVEISWVGSLTNLWYYVDPFLNNSSIREDNGLPGTMNTNPGGGDKTLNLLASSTSTSGDYIVNMYYDKNGGVTKANRFYSDATGNLITSPIPSTITFDQLNYLWEAGIMLWKRDPTTASGKRKIYTTLSSGPTWSFLPGNFSADTLNGDTNNSAILAPYLQAVNSTEASNIINWVQGIDPASGYCSATTSSSCNTDADCPSGQSCVIFRSRTVKVDLNGDGNTTDNPVTCSGCVGSGMNENIPRVWKLGDTINSTPKIVSWTALNSYGTVYGDSTYGDSAALEDPPNPNQFAATSAYKKRGMVFAGGNDGMLHAFKLGTLQLHWSTQGSTQKARLLNPDYPTDYYTTGTVCSNSDTVPCGQEMWAYIPKHVLPYLKYMASNTYCHLSSVDLTPYIFDASINGGANARRNVSSWRTVLIGGMRTGGACRMQGEACNAISGVTGTNCVNTPLLDPADNTKGLGYSVYFALDITDPNNPSLMWEFANDSLGFSTTGPAIVRIDGTNTTTNKPDKSLNGNWFVVIGSGPTGGIDAGIHQFLGRSDQNMKLFVLDLRTGAVVATIDSGITDAFAGSLIRSTLDINTDYQDDVVYVPYVRLDSSAGTWTQGGVGRLVTNADPNPANWTWSTLIDGVGPVTAAVAKVYDATMQNLWVYFGTGRYYYVRSSSADDPNGQRYLFGIKDPCVTQLSSNSACTAGQSFSALTDVTNISNVPGASVANASGFNGWYVQMDQSGAYTYSPDPQTNFWAERDVTDPLATTGGVVYFTTFKPYTDVCLLGGKTFIWAFQYNTGGAPTGLKGQVLVQLSTGAIQQQNLSSAFTSAGGRKTASMEGKPPEVQGLNVISAPAPVNRIVHVRER